MPEIIFNGPEGRLEGRYAHSKTPDAPLALILHPNPEHGGTMNNKITYMMFQAMKQRGFSVLRFNFRGVGKSEGTFDNAEGELSDAASVLDWLQSYNPNAPACWVAGFSFGAWVSMQLLMRRPEIDGFLALSPPANHYDLSFLAPCPASGLILCGDNDAVCAPGDVERALTKVRVQTGEEIERQTIEGANHFYQHHLAEMEHACEAYLLRRLEMAEQKLRDEAENDS